MPSSSDVQEIRELIESQFESLTWTPEHEGDWARCQAGFFPFAQLFASKRPANPQSGQDFVSRMRSLRDDGTLTHFTERGRNVRIWVVGNIAVALAGCEMTENTTEVTRDVSGFLLLKDPAGWRIAAQAWDIVDDIDAAFAAAGASVQAD